MLRIVKRMPPLLLAALVVLVCVSAAFARKPSLRFQPRVVQNGHTTRVRGNAGNCGRGSTVMILSRAFTGHVFAGLGGVKTKVRNGGFFTAVARVRVRAHGNYKVSLRCGGANLGAAKQIKVV
jgi:hypothetical protein